MRHVGSASELLHVVKGAALGWPGDDQTTVDPSEAGHLDDPKVWVNALVNEALHRRQEVTWWWVEAESARAAADRAAALQTQWQPAWNRQTPAEPEEPKRGTARKTATKPAAKSVAKAPIAEEPKAPTRVVCPTCWTQLPLATRWCDNCERSVPA